MGEVIVVTSGKGGVGKTTTTANLGAPGLTSPRIIILVSASSTCPERRFPL